MYRKITREATNEDDIFVIRAIDKYRLIYNDSLNDYSTPLVITHCDCNLTDFSCRLRDAVVCFDGRDRKSLSRLR